MAKIIVALVLILVALIGIACGYASIHQTLKPRMGEYFIRQTIFQISIMVAGGVIIGALIAIIVFNIH